MIGNNERLDFYHAAPEFVLRGYDFCVGVAARIGAAGGGGIDLVWSAGEAGGRIGMSESVAPGFGGGEYALLFATIPASFLAGAGSVSYGFAGKDGKIGSEEYAVEIADAGELPPLIVTELYARPKGLGVSAYIEVMNPTGEPADLYDYRLMAFRGEDLTAKVILDVELADAPGREIIEPRTLALLWPQYPRHHAPGNERYTTAEGFSEVLNAELPKPMFEVDPEELKLIKVEFCRYDEATAAYVYRDGAAELPSKIERTTLLLVPRSGTAADAIFSMTYNMDDGCHRDTPVRHSSLWGIDARNPSRGVVQKHRSRATPGRFSEGQGFPDFGAGYPVIFPVSDGEMLRASLGGLRLEFDLLTERACGVAVSLKAADGRIIERDAVREEGGRYAVSFPEEITDRLLELEYFVTAYDGVRRSYLGSAGAPLVTRIVDDKGPVITSLMPTEKFAYDGDRTPEISVGFFDVSGVDTSGSALFVDRKNVTKEAAWEPGSVRYTPQAPLRRGGHEFEIILKDNLGNTTLRQVSFTVCRADELKLYRGEVHSHTADSDGIAGPDEAIVYARDVGGVDFFALTEHSHYMAGEVYAEQMKKADGYDAPGRFAALYGWEMTWNATTGLWGHMNILNTRWIVNNIKENGVPEIYGRLKADRGAVAMFNHPGLAWGNFLNYSNYSPDADRAVCLAEIKSAGYDREYVNMLALGWHAAPVFNEDNHAYSWTTGTNSTTFALAPALTRENILDAFRRRRTYSTSDPTMRIYFRVNGEWMGSRLRSPGKLDVDVKITTENERGIGNIALVSEDNITVASINAGALREYHWKLKLSPVFDYYYVKVTSQGHYTVTAPVWLEEEAGGRQPLNIKKFSFSRGEDGYKPNVMTAEIVNDGQGELRSIAADFYLTPASGFDLCATAPYASVNLSDLAAGESAEVSCSFPDLAGLRRATVIVRGLSGSRRCGDTAAGLLAPLRVTEVCAETSPITDSAGKTIKNPFSYMRIYNSSNRAVNLDGCFTRLWASTGKAPAEDKMLRLDGASIPAGGSLTVWRRPRDSALEAADFNRHYGVELVENADLLVSDIPFISSSPEARRLELMCGTETLSRVEYNFGGRVGKDVVPDTAIVFDYNPNLTGTSAIAIL